MGVRMAAAGIAEVKDLASLADLAPSTRAVVMRVDSHGPLGRRLLDLGFVPGTEVRVLRRAPLQDPIALELRGYQICLRRRDARRIRVRPLAAPRGVEVPESARDEPRVSGAGGSPAPGAALPRSSAH